jgi:hypothetical protein
MYTGVLRVVLKILFLNSPLPVRLLVIEKDAPSLIVLCSPVHRLGIEGEHRQLHPS